MLKKQRPKLTKELWCDLWRLLKKFHVRIIWILVIIALFEIIKTASPYLLKIVIDELSHFKSEKIASVIALVIIYFIIQIIVDLLNHFKSGKAFNLVIDIEYHSRMAMQKKLVSLPLAYHERENTGNKIIKVEMGVEKLSQFISYAYLQIWPIAVRIIFIFVAMLYFSWLLSSLFIFFVLIFIWITFFLNKKLIPLRKERVKEYEKASGVLGQSIFNIYTVQSFTQEKQEVRKYKKINDNIVEMERIEFFKYYLNFNTLRNIVVNLGRISILLCSVYLVWQGNVSIGSLVLFLFWSESAYISLFTLSKIYDQLMDSAVGAQRVPDLLKEESEIKNDSQVDIKNKLQGHVEFKNVDFAYQKNSGPNALQNINFKINPGETIALVGRSGGGKSTIIKLLYRHYDVTGGQILVDGVDIRHYDLFKFRENLSIVPQDVEIFNESLRNNIAYARMEANLEEVKNAAHIANIDFVNNLENAYNTSIGERGVKLSGGEKQRVGIARAIISHPSILIFDEATSNLDSHSEKLIQKAIEKISNLQTMIIIAHRLSTVINADKIIVIDKGRIAEIGTHDELMKNKDGFYSALLRLQAIGELV